ncbi:MULTISPECIES: beta-ketoacyl-ACP synthase III [Sphingobacterium]|jgi:3-oxoacyl-[acyl-carrier-protein] synthase-3|uniref:Beta-ketoacyl-[acyl-carrier-protein] synthase III n=2 Tax=Sphingobacterium TaxID=28453 RepID=A0ABW5YTQ4_9SPHI|nr:MULTISPECIES: beta-ketoacyl-ACP synthase III [Sphingobacterium]KKX50936.1 3-oxoacyl-ACP synthase [Sphingobacterium sp. IITKGP-BTPF85]MBB2952734.1 3-oxoacyl-[acyl-carrier-protein] synthase-3 [Sphingobacterium sp. JUb56]MCS3555594.1 3-oxoacyl-[acyl-carrier-protein] synthase-3 [Sphingobacterium sp. JUb21]MCW2261197.1 3-oxoacyl-[acyl-carrier-protein] synthase-3 [Sphingobacterium kitahiroshimense]NJI75990.1 ketoacyl-ACP synthase III [Sphingobacterium sp. B16(2022)]
MSKIHAAITAVGGYVPDYILTNKELETMVETNDEWIVSRTGIKERRILKGEGKATSDLAVPAVQQLLEKRGITAKDIDLIIFCTSTPDMLFPATANILADKIGATNAWGYDLQAACSGFLFGLTTGVQFIESGKHTKVLVVGADKMSSVVNYQDRNTCILFGDGCGVVLLEPNTDGNGIQDAILKTDGSGGQYLNIKGGGSLNPASHATVDAGLHYAYQEGKTVFKFAVTNMANVAAEIMEKNNLQASDIAYLVPHQANKRIIDATAERAGLPEEKVMINIQKYGNTTSATIPLCLWEWESKLKKGDNLILAAFGGGFTWGSVYLKWAY